MYNAEQKVNFIRQYTSSIKYADVCKNAFDAIEANELNLNKDVSSWSIEELNSMLSDVLGLSSSSQTTKLTIYREYVKWCLTNRITDSTDNIFHLKISASTKINKRLIANPTHLQNILDMYYAPERLQSSDSIYRAYCWVVYSGVYPEDALKVKINDVDLSTLTIKFNGREYPIYREGLLSIKNVCELKSFRYIHPNYPDKIIWKERFPGDTIIRGTKNVITPIVLSSEMSREVRKAKREGRFDFEISSDRIWLSGLFYREYERERAGIKPDFIEIAEDIVAGVECKATLGYSANESATRKKKYIATRYQTDYERWKIIYNF